MAQVNSSVDKNKIDCSLFNTYLAGILSQTHTHTRRVDRSSAGPSILAFVNDVHRQVEVKVRLERADGLEHQLVMDENVKKDEVYLLCHE